MKILLINEVCGTGSTGRICTDIAFELERQGNDVKIAYGRDGNVPSSCQHFAVRIGRDFDVKMHALKTRLFDKAGFGSIRATKKFITWVRKFDPDIIHLHNLHGYYINIEILFDYLKKSDKKIFWTLHDCWAYTGHSAYCDVASCTKWKIGCSNCPQKNIYPRSYVDKSKENWHKKKKIFSNVNNLTIICPSKWLGNQVRESFLHDYPLKIIHNGIDTDVFFIRKNDFRDVYQIKNKYVIFGLLVSGQSADLFIKLSHMIGENVELVIYGNISENERKKFGNNVIWFLDIESKKELLYIYDACDICVDYKGTIITTEVDLLKNLDANDEKEYSLDKKKVTDLLKQVAYNSTHLKKDTQMNEYNDIYGYWAIKRKNKLVGKMILISVATVWSDLKGVSDIFKLATMLPKSVYILLIGKLEDTYLSKCPSNIIYIPRTHDKNEMAEYYNMADLYINCTYCDTYPTVNLEAISCGVPVITYEVGGSTEIVNELGGVVCQKGNINQMCSIIKQYNVDRVNNKELKIDRIDMVQQYINLYQED